MLMNTHVINGDKAHVYYDHDRAFWGCEPWVATWDGYDGSPIDYDTPSRDPIGQGRTEQEALDDLMEQSE
jgi:hypothetical protein